MLFAATVLGIKFSMNKNLSFFEISFFFSVTMKFLRNVLRQQVNEVMEKGDVPLSVKMACLFKDLRDFFFEKNVAKKLQVEKIGKKPKN